MRQAWASAGVATLLALSLGACSDRAGQSATAPDASGAGDTAKLVRPAAPDGPPGGPSGIAGSAPHSGASGADAIPGTTGSGTADAGGRSQTAQPGIGLNGGLNSGAGLTGSFPSASNANATSTAMGSGPAGDGSPNAGSGSAVGSR